MIATLPTTPPAAGQPAPTEDTIRAQYRALEWSGECKYGLLHGWGALGTRENWEKNPRLKEVQQDYYFGRAMFMRSQPALFGIRPGTTTLVTIGSRYIELTNTGEGSPFWGWDILSGSQQQPEPATSYTDADRNFVETYKASCGIAQYQKNVARCDGEGTYPVFGVKHGVGTEGVVTMCPDPRTSAGCFPTWAQYLRPILQAHSTFLEEAKVAETARRAELDTLNAGYVAQWAAAEERRKAAARAAEAAAAAAKERQERAFTASLSTLGAGQLFTKADELDRAGDPEKARAARTALINRFPNSPLAATAAQQMAGGGAAPGGATSAPATAGAPRAFEGSNCRDAIQRNTDAINRQPPPTTQVGRYQQILGVAADRLAILDQFCRGDSVAYGDYAPVKKLYDDTMRTCLQDRGSAQNECRPVRTWAGESAGTSAATPYTPPAARPAPRASASAPSPAKQAPPGYVNHCGGTNVIPRTQGCSAQ